MTTPRALIFDVDGTLAETEEVHRRAFNETFSTAGLDWHWSVTDYTWLLKTTGGAERMRAYRDHLGDGPPDDEIAALHSRKTLRFGQIVAAGQLDLRPGVADLIARAKTGGLRVGVATTTARANVDALCHACFGAPMGDVFDAVAAGDEVARKKPDPEVYALALSRLGIEAEAAIAIEDSRNGLVSAKAAGLKVIVTPSAYTAGEDFCGADWVIPDLAQPPLPAPLTCLLAG